MSPNLTLQDWLRLPDTARRQLLESVRADAITSQESHGAYIAVADGPLPDKPGVLSSIPYAVKDNIDVAGFETTGGTSFLTGAPAVIDANVVNALCFEGGIVVGKTNLHELAFGVTSNNAEFGPVRNPLDSTRTAGGSSGGSAATVALGTVPFALGTDTGGSITVPAAFCGIVGYRPTTGRYPGDGVINLSWSRDTIGILANNTSDIQTIDRIITRSRNCGSTVEAQNVRLGVPANYFEDLDEQVRTVISAALERIQEAGITLVDVEVPGAIDVGGTAGFGLVFYEAVVALHARTATLPGPLSSLRVGDMAKLAKSDDVKQVLAMISEQGPTAAAYEDMRRARWELRRAYEQIMANAGIDAFVFASVPVLPPPIGQDETVELNGRNLPLFPTITRHSGPGTFVGAPMVSLPAGRTLDGLSVGVTLEGRFGDDELLLRAASLVGAIL